MRKNSIKNTRVNGEVQKVLSEIIRGEIKDPRISPMTSVVQVQVAPDLKTCKAYISVLGGNKEQEDTIAGPAECSGVYPPAAGRRAEPSEYTGDYVYSGSVHRIRDQHVKTY